MAASICKARILRFRCMLLRREDKAQAIPNTSFPSTVISYRKKNKAIVPELNEWISLQHLQVPHSQQVWWTSSQPARCTFNLYEIGCGLRAKFTSSMRKGGVGGRLKNSTYQLFWAQNPLRHPELSISQHGFPSKDTSIFELPASKHSPEEQIFWGTDPLGAPSSTLELSIASSQDNVWEILYFGSHSWYLNGRLLHHFVTRYCEQPPRSNV